MNSRLITLAAIALISSAISAAAVAQAPGEAKAPAAVERADLPVNPTPSVTQIPRFDSRSTASSVANSRMSPAEIRQARALYRSQQRVARLEHNLWMGVEPLRPNWNSVPMMSSRYTNQRVYIPVYVYGR
jgi:hypothetical protein